MKFTGHQAHGVLVRVYLLDKDERIHRHSDPFDHTTSCANGRTRLFKFPVENHISSVEIKAGRTPENIPAFMEHEILSMEDGTVVINICPI